MKNKKPKGENEKQNRWREVYQITGRRWELETLKYLHREIELIRMILPKNKTREEWDIWNEFYSIEAKYKIE